MSNLKSEENNYDIYEPVPTIGIFAQLVFAYIRAFKSLPQIGYSFGNECGNKVDMPNEHMIVSEVNIFDEYIVIRLKYDLIL